MLLARGLAPARVAVRVARRVPPVGGEIAAAAEGDGAVHHQQLLVVARAQGRAGEFEADSAAAEPPRRRPGGQVPAARDQHRHVPDQHPHVEVRPARRERAKEGPDLVGQLRPRRAILHARAEARARVEVPPQQQDRTPRLEHGVARRGEIRGAVEEERGPCGRLDAPAGLAGPQQRRRGPRPTTARGRRRRHAGEGDGGSGIGPAASCPSGRRGGVSMEGVVTDPVPRRQITPSLRRRRNHIAAKESATKPSRGSSTGGENTTEASGRSPRAKTSSRPAPMLANRTVPGRMPSAVAAAKGRNDIPTSAGAMLPTGKGTIGQEAHGEQIPEAVALQSRPQPLHEWARPARDRRRQRRSDRKEQDAGPGRRCRQGEPGPEPAAEQEATCHGQHRPGRDRNRDGGRVGREVKQRRRNGPVRHHPGQRPAMLREGVERGVAEQAERPCQDQHRCQRRQRPEPGPARSVPFLAAPPGRRVSHCRKIPWHRSPERLRQRNSNPQGFTFVVDCPPDEGLRARTLPVSGAGLRPPDCALLRRPRHRAARTPPATSWPRWPLCCGTRPRSPGRRRDHGRRLAHRRMTCARRRRRLRADRDRGPGRPDRVGGAAPLRPAVGGAGPALRHPWLDYVVGRPDRRGNLYPAKQRSEQKIEPRSR